MKMNKIVITCAISMVVGIGIGYGLGRESEPPPPTREQLMSYIESLSAHEIDGLKQSLQARWGVKAAPPSSGFSR
jgi:hypothetical protein